MELERLLIKYKEQAENYKDERDRLLDLQGLSEEIYQRGIECDVLYNKCLEIQIDLEYFLTYNKVTK